jgi:NAD-dependent deacetylase
MGRLLITMDDKLRDIFASWNKNSEILVLTGAGISAESGISTFRNSSGLWENYKVEDVATPEGFEKDPEKVISFYNMRRLAAFNAKPNLAHIELANLASALGERFHLVTQNVDSLHEDAGSPQVCHMHGELFKLRCLQNNFHQLSWRDEQHTSDLCPYCFGGLRPDIVWFGEEPYHLKKIWNKALHCSHLVIIGTSLTVQPAASLIDVAKAQGAKVVIIDPDPSPNPLIDYFLRKPATQGVPEVADIILTLDKNL